MHGVYINVNTSVLQIASANTSTRCMQLLSLLLLLDPAYCMYGVHAVLAHVIASKSRFCTHIRCPTVLGMDNGSRAACFGLTHPSLSLLWCLGPACAAPLQLTPLNLSNMARMKAQKQQVTTLVPHRTPNLSDLRVRAQTGDSSQAVKAYLDAGGSPSAALRARLRVDGAEHMVQLPILHSIALTNFDRAPSQRAG
eukprot:7943-Heterococcus_DN1.PRE.5